MPKSFFIGYQSRMPEPVSRFIRKWLIGTLLLVALLAGLFVMAQKGFAPSRFEFGNIRSFEGIIKTSPYPMLLVERPEADEKTARFSHYILVSPGKKGATDLANQYDGHRVVLDGTLVYRETQTMIEVVPDSIESLASDQNNALPAVADLGTHTFIGEIVDSKCYLGVMKPGNLKLHRSCAIRCISGGIPPVLLVRDEQDNAVYFMLTDANGGTVNQDILDVVAEPLEITGRLMRQGELMVLMADPETYRRLNKQPGKHL